MGRAKVAGGRPRMSCAPRPRRSTRPWPRGRPADAATVASGPAQIIDKVGERSGLAGDHTVDRPGRGDRQREVVALQRARGRRRRRDRCRRPTRPCRRPPCWGRRRGGRAAGLAGRRRRTSSRHRTSETRELRARRAGAARPARLRLARDRPPRRGRARARALRRVRVGAPTRRSMRTRCCTTSTSGSSPDTPP